MNILVAYATTHGSSAEIAQFMGKVLEERGHQPTISNVAHVNTVENYDAFVLGSPIYVGTWMPELSNFLKAFAPALNAHPVYLWVACIRILEENGQEHVLEFYLQHDLLCEINVREVGTFAGRLNLEETDWNERWTLAARYDGGTWPSSFNGDFRNWEKIRLWAEGVADDLG
jgi:menaquinone-dependent protoporphyrinogen oxidase